MTHHTGQHLFSCTESLTIKCHQRAAFTNVGLGVVITASTCIRKYVPIWRHCYIMLYFFHYFHFPFIGFQKSENQENILMTYVSGDAVAMVMEKCEQEVLEMCLIVLRKMFPTEVSSVYHW